MIDNSKIKKILSIFLNAVSVLLIIAAFSVSVLIFATDNRYGEPVFGETMLLSVREDVKIGKDIPIENGSLAVIDLSIRAEGDYYAAFLGNRTVITGESLSSIGAVKGHIPYLGGVMDFFRKPSAFFLCIVTPLFAAVACHAIRVALLIKSRGDKNKNGKPKPEGGGE